jgi:hypothetical protein
LAKAAFDDGIEFEDGTLMDIGGRVSRKKDYIPSITKAIKGGWTKPLTRGASDVDLADLGHLEVDPLDPCGRPVRKESIFAATGAKRVRQTLLNMDLGSLAE